MFLFLLNQDKGHIVLFRVHALLDQGADLLRRVLNILRVEQQDLQLLIRHRAV